MPTANIMIASKVKELSFNDFIINLTLPCILTFVFTVLILLFLYRKEFAKVSKNHNRVMNIKLAGLIRSRGLLVRCLVTLVFTIALFCSHGLIPHWGLESGTIAVTGASLLLLLTMPDREKALEHIFSKIEWTTIFFFVGLFVLVGGLEVNGIINWLAAQTMNLTGGEPVATTMSVLWLSAIMSAFVDNIPFVATMIPLVQDMGAMGYQNLEPLWWALSLGACLGGNGTVIGASANVVALGLARQHNLRVSFMQYFVVGFPLMLMSIVISSLYLFLMYL